MSETMTVTRGLAELKLLNARITKEIAQTIFVDTYQERKDRTANSFVTKAEFEKNVNANMQSIEALIGRRNDIKSAILKSNALTKVKVGGKEFTIVEAIDRKTAINFNKQLLANMKIQYGDTLTRVTQYKVKLDADVQKMIEANLGKEKSVEEDDYKKLAEPFIKANELKMIDPIGIRVKIEKYGKEIDEFETEIDFVLSESNARTEITI